MTFPLALLPSLRDTVRQLSESGQRAPFFLLSRTDYGAGSVRTAWGRVFLRTDNSVPEGKDMVVSKRTYQRMKRDGVVIE